MAKKTVHKRPVRRSASKSVKKSTTKETVRVKTFIVEKPVYIQAPPQRITQREEPEEEVTFDSRRSRYLKKREQRELLKKRMPEEDEFGEGEYADEGMPQEKAKKGKKELEEDDLPAEDDLAAGDDLPAEDDLPEDGADDLGEEGLGEEELPAGEEGEMLEEGYAEGQAGGAKTHVRSHGMFTNLWWKKAIIWAVFAWLIILGIGLAMQAMKLSEVDLTRQWWILLGILIVISMIYQKLFAGKIKI